MCGIVGIFDPTDTPDRDQIRGMYACLAHRGPDDEGTYVDGPVGLGHRRLAIIDPDGGHQPVFNEDGDVVVVFNGEIYNYQSLRSTLETAGHRFSTDTDTEVLVHLYEEHGPAFVAELDGMFAFALYDATAERVILARDRFGIKPLLLGVDDDRIVFASELPAFFEAPLSLGGLDETALGAYFGLGFIPSPMTAFENVSKVRPGEVVRVDADGVSRECYYTPSIRARSPSLDEAATGVRSRVESAVAQRLMSDVPLGAFLSGGIDSSIVVGVMSDLLDGPVRTFTVGFEETQFDESWAARTVADHFGTNHTEFTCRPDELRGLVTEVLSRLGEPFADPSLLPTYVVARETSDNVTVALSGDGGDELFAGYGKYRGEYLSSYYRQVPQSVRRRFVEPALDRLPVSRKSATGEAVRKLERFTEGGDPDRTRRHFGWLRIADDDALASIRTDPEPRMASEKTITAATDRVTPFLPADRRDPLTTMQATDVAHSLPDQLLTKVDLASMYNSLEVRTPFLDRRVVEYAFSLPRSAHITPMTRKRVLKRAFADDLPEEIRTRRKQGFDMPIGDWFRGPLADEFEWAVRSLPGDLLDTDAVLTAYDHHCRRRVERSKFLWSVYVYAQWRRTLANRDVL